MKQKKMNTYRIRYMDGQIVYVEATSIADAAKKAPQTLPTDRSIYGFRVNQDFIRKAEERDFFDWRDKMTNTPTTELWC